MFTHNKYVGWGKHKNGERPSMLNKTTRYFSVKATLVNKISGRRFLFNRP